MSALYTLNNEKNGIEVSFQEKPAGDVLQALKGAGFRWHRVKKVWYAKQTTDRITLAESLAALEAPITPVKATETINLDNLATTKLSSYYNVDIAAAIRSDLKARGVKGATVRASRGSGITVTIKATPADFTSIEEYSMRYTFEEFSCDAQNYHGVFDGEKWIYSHSWEAMSNDERRAAYDSHIRYYLRKNKDINIYHIERKNYPGYTTAFFNKIKAVFLISNQWNYDNSDRMSDYYDVGYYLSIDVKAPVDFVIRETMTDDEKAAYEAEKAAEKAERERQYNEYLKEQAEREKAYQEREKARQAALKIISENTTVIDLPEPEQMYITNLVGGIGKEATLSELKETIETSPYDHRNDAVITRKVIFTHEAYEAFCGLFLDDFEFLRDKGGTGSEDIRLEGVKTIYSLNNEQRESVKWFMCDCVAIYDGDNLALVSNPEGHSYSRYTYLLSDGSEILSAAGVLDDQKKDSETKAPFYFPEPIKEQIKAIQPGNDITVYQCDGWLLNSVYGGSGTVIRAYPGDYAQYKGYYIDLMQGKKVLKVFIRDDKTCLIYKGIKPLLPDEVTREKIKDNMYELFNYNELFPRIIEYYAGKGEAPILDTYQR